MIPAALRDLLFRRRRYLISAFGCALVFAMSLLMTGLADAFPKEWRGVVNGGMPGVVVPLSDAQEILFRGVPLVTAGVFTEDPGSEVAPEGFRVQSADSAVEDALRLLASARQSIDFVKVLLWIVAALIVGSVTFLSIIERLREFAVFKAVGTSVRSIAAGVILQTVVLAVASALLGVALGWLIAPTFPLPVVISSRAALLLPVLGAGVGVIASLFGLSRVLNVEPALAFGGAA